MYHTNISTAAALSFSDLSKEEGEAWIQRFPGHSAVSFAGELTHAGYKDASVSYLLCEEDIVIPAKIQRDGIELIEKESGNKVDVTCIKTGHVPMAGAPQEVINWIVQEAEKDEIQFSGMGN